MPTVNASYRYTFGFTNQQKPGLIEEKFHVQGNRR